MDIIDDEATMTTLKAALVKYLKPLLPGAALSGPCRGETNPECIVWHDTKHRLRVYASGLAYYFVFERTLPFSEEERTFLEHIMQDVYDGFTTHDASMEGLMAASVDKAVSRHVAPDFRDTVSRVIALYEAWRGQSHGKSAHTIGIQEGGRKNTQTNFFEVAEKYLVHSLASSPDTLMVINGSGAILGVEKVRSYTTEAWRQEIFAPAAYAHLAMWARSQRKVAIRLTEDGVILLFTRRRLAFAKRESVWFSPPHTLIDAVSIPEGIDGIDPETAKAVYLTTLDLAAGNKPARINIIRNSRKKSVASELGKTVFAADAYTSSQNARLLSVLVNGRRFCDIPRTVRTEICSLGGTLFLDGQGTILGLDLSGGTTADSATSAGQTVGKVFSGSAYMELINRDGQCNLHLAIC